MRIQFLHPPTLVSPGNLQTATPTHPLGLAYVMAALREAGHDCVLLDAIGEAPAQRTAFPGAVRLGLTDDQIYARIDPGARAIAITNMFSFNWPLLRELIRGIRGRFPEKLIVCGGEHFSGLPEYSMQQAPIDFIVLGEGEGVALDLFEHLERGGGFDPGGIGSLCWRRGHEIVRNPRAARATDIDKIPWPAWDLFDMEAYEANHLTNGLALGRTVPVLATRGCPYACSYCSNPQMWGRRWVVRDPISVADEIEFYHRQYGATNFPFQDLTMIVKRDWILRFCRSLLGRGLEITWQLPSGTRCEVIDDEVAGLLRRSGCRWLCYAPESGSERTRELIRKRMKSESLERAVDASVRARLHLEIFCVIGFPHDTAADLRATAALARNMARRGVEDLAVNFFFPIPDTELFDYLVEKGRIVLGDEVLMHPLLVHSKTLTERRSYCEHLSAAALTRWKYWILMNFYLTAWLTHPLRVPRIVANALSGRQTSVMEKFLAQRRRRLLRRLRRGKQTA